MFRPILLKPVYSDINQSRSLKKFIDSGKEKRERIRKRSPRNDTVANTSNGEASDRHRYKNLKFLTLRYILSRKETLLLKYFCALSIISFIDDIFVLIRLAKF